MSQPCVLWPSYVRFRIRSFAAWPARWTRDVVPALRYYPYRGTAAFLAVLLTLALALALALALTGAARIEFLLGRYSHLTVMVSFRCSCDREMIQRFFAAPGWLLSCHSSVEDPNKLRPMPRPCAILACDKRPSSRLDFSTFAANANAKRRPLGRP